MFIIYIYNYIIYIFLGIILYSGVIIFWFSLKVRLLGTYLLTNLLFINNTAIHILYLLITPLTQLMKQHSFKIQIGNILHYQTA